jgi:hypothetical protein
MSALGENRTRWDGANDVNDPLRSSVLQCAKWPLQNVWHTRLTDPRRFGILQNAFLAGRGAIQFGLLKRREFITMSSTSPA